MTNVDKVAKATLEMLAAQFEDKIPYDDVRLGVGQALAVIHAAAISTAKDKSEQADAVLSAMDTVDRLMHSIKGVAKDNGMTVNIELNDEQPTREELH